MPTSSTTVIRYRYSHRAYVEVQLRQRHDTHPLVSDEITRRRRSNSTREGVEHVSTRSSRAPGSRERHSQRESRSDRRNAPSTSKESRNGLQEKDLLRRGDYVVTGLLREEDLGYVDPRRPDNPYFNERVFRSYCDDHPNLSAKQKRIVDGYQAAIDKSAAATKEKLKTIYCDEEWDIEIWPVDDKCQAVLRFWSFEDGGEKVLNEPSLQSGRFTYPDDAVEDLRWVVNNHYM
ncbi:hypothetical protein BU24DRAFT_427304 [Aaosphaeria arxii CBS 175.79]|uniref:Uncharacterized protein n=1 Tax=Aaosphaeria arxii CBS 175.79 TaxID=1450172 RepID=A0A6A5XD97_9PLEO|nr:uncharacterized protein BU24DRAFT_427304 [Aaosphaeria arxii CBS 175.79]KAF2011095.1 hypothetical protein BU24DRAFT_427304 [Aaosphaeria arxii CBS 175.79]